MNLSIHIRDKKGKGAASRSRKANRIPGILYGRGFSSQPVEIDSRALQKALLTGAGDSQLIDLVIESKEGQKTEKGLIKEIQRHPVTDRIQHVDFYRVIMTEKIEVEVALMLTGVPIGIKKGGVLEKRMDTIRVRCLPANIPEHFTMDVSTLDVGNNLHVSDLKFPADILILTDPTQVLAVVTEVKTVEEVAPVAAAAAATPEAGAATGATAPATEADAKDKKAAGEVEKKEGGKEKEGSKEKSKGKG